MSEPIYIETRKFKDITMPGIFKAVIYTYDESLKKKLKNPNGWGTGIYFLLSEKEHIIYVGVSNTLYQRAQNPRDYDYDTKIVVTSAEEKFPIPAGVAHELENHFYGVLMNAGKIGSFDCKNEDTPECYALTEYERELYEALYPEIEKFLKDRIPDLFVDIHGFRDGVLARNYSNMIESQVTFDSWRLKKRKRCIKKLLLKRDSNIVLRRESNGGFVILKDSEIISPDFFKPEFYYPSNMASYYDVFKKLLKYEYLVKDCRKDKFTESETVYIVFKENIIFKSLNWIDQFLFHQQEVFEDKKKDAESDGQLA